jgi:hypothetical protein
VAPDRKAVLPPRLATCVDERWVVGRRVVVRTRRSKTAPIALGFLISLVSRNDTQAVQYAMIVVLARMVIELAFLLKEIAGWTAMFGSRMIELSSWLSSVTSVS